MAGHEWQDLVWQGGDGRHWPPEARLLAAYLLTGPATNRIGCIPFAFEAAAHHTGLSAERINEIVAYFVAEEFVRFDSRCGWIWVPDVLRMQVFTSIEEVRRALPELASVPREATFRYELVQLFRSSADRPGAPQNGGTGLFSGWLGEDRATHMAQLLSGLNAKIRSELPGLPLLEPANLQPLTRLVVAAHDYGRRCGSFLANLVDARELRLLGIAAIICAVLFIVFPGIDLGVERWFFEPPRNFVIGASWIGRFFDTDIHYGMEWFLAVIACVFAYGVFRRRAIWGLTCRRFLFVALSIALGAGLMTNVIFKDSWGRARPSQIVEFGGAKQFSPPFMRSDQCEKNCSFVSGDASLAASFMAFAVIADRHRRRWWFGLGSFTVLVGFMRMARGSHFLSDVVFAIIFTLMIVFVLARLILEQQWRAWPTGRSELATPGEP
jgi:lipid A 4'-phosphatase